MDDLPATASILGQERMHETVGFKRAFNYSEVAHNLLGMNIYIYDIFLAVIIFKEESTKEQNGIWRNKKLHETHLIKESQYKVPTTTQCIPHIHVFHVSGCD